MKQISGHQSAEQAFVVTKAEVLDRLKDLTKQVRGEKFRAVDGWGAAASLHDVLITVERLIRFLNCTGQ